MFLLLSIYVLQVITASVRRLSRRLPLTRAARVLRALRSAAMALSKLSGDEQRILFVQLRNVLEPRTAVYLSGASNELRTATQALLQQLRADHEAAAALCGKVGLRSCKELREAKEVVWIKGLSSDDLALLGTLGSVLQALETLMLV